MNNNIKDLVYKMLTESTGINIMDSGGGENRGWQRNQKRSIEDFNNESEVTVDIYGDVTNSKDIGYTISVFHYLTRSLELDEICNDFNAIENKDWDSGIYGVSKKQAKWLENQGFEIGDSFNTYNGESSLSQILQGTYIKLGVNNYVLLQIHNGCDARGGYTDAKMFYLPDEYMPSESVYGTIDGIEVDNSYDGISLTDEQGEAVKANKDSKVKLSM